MTAFEFVLLWIAGVAILILIPVLAAILGHLWYRLWFKDPWSR